MFRNDKPTLSLKKISDLNKIGPIQDAILNKIAVRVAPKHGGQGYLTPQVNLAQYITRIRSTPEKPFILDGWQEDLCRRLEQAFWCSTANKFQFEQVDVDGAYYVRAPNGFLIESEKFMQQGCVGTLAAIHAPPQFGKSNIIAVAYPAWIFGFDPLHRFRLATYNIMHSTRFSKAILQIMRSPEHKAIFPDPKGHLPVRTRFVEWWTNARQQLNDGQSSFTALGLTSGFVGTGADTLLQDDPYASAEQARSETIRDSTWRFQSETAKPRLREHSNNFIMFHRYHTDDQGGRAIASGEFELWRYPAVADGTYVDEESGREFPSLPLNRLTGEFLSSRYLAWYYTAQQKNVEVWNSQFQGRPTTKAGTFFDITRIGKITISQVPDLIHQVRAWDNAATDRGGDFTAGARIGIDALGNFYLLSMKRAQVDTAGRKKLQALTADEDGLMVPIHYPQDPGSAGKDMAFEFAQEHGRQGFAVISAPITGSKTARAHDFSVAVNDGKFRVVTDGDIDIRAFKAELRDFPLVGLYKDQVDACADAVTFVLKQSRRGRVIKSNHEQNLLEWSLFSNRFGDGMIPSHWEVAVACRIASNASFPSAWAIVARAAENAGLGEVVFVVASARKFVGDAGPILEDIKDAIIHYCAGGIEQCQAIWIPRANTSVIRLGQEKFNLYLQEFQGDEMDGLPETGWYFAMVAQPHPFYLGQANTQACRCYILCDDRQMRTPFDEAGQLSLRQDMLNWSFNSEGKPQPFGGNVLDCVRMVLHDFWLTATQLTPTERLYAQLPTDLQPQEINKHRGTQRFIDDFWAHRLALGEIAQREREQAEEEEHEFAECRPARHGRYK